MNCGLAARDGCRESTITVPAARTASQVLTTTPWEITTPLPRLAVLPLASSARTATTLSAAVQGAASADARSPRAAAGAAIASTTPTISDAMRYIRLPVEVGPQLPGAAAGANGAVG